MSRVTVNSEAQGSSTKVYKCHSFSVYLVCGAAFGWQLSVRVVFLLFQAVSLKGQAGTMGFPGLLSHVLDFQELPSSSIGHAFS